jgi:hypothetical protein
LGNAQFPAYIVAFRKERELRISWIVNHPMELLGVLVLLCLLLRFALRNVEFSLRKEYGGALAVASATMIGLFVYVVVVYALTPQLRDHIEPQVASVSYLLLNGKPLYPPPDAAEQYTLPYGPYTYLWPAAYYWVLGPSLLSTKLSGAISGLAAVAVLLWACKRTAGWWVALPCTALATVVDYRFETHAFWCRPDSHQLLLMSLSLLALTMVNPWSAAVLLGVCTGINANMKIDSLAYALPIMAALYLRHRKWSPLILAAFFALIVAAAPFAIPGISLANLATWLRLESRHPFGGELELSLIFLAWLVEMLLIGGLPSMLLNGTSDPQRRQWWITAAALGIAILGVMPVTAKTGTGAHHLLPFVPVICWMIAWAWSIGNGSPAPAAGTHKISLRHLLILPIAIVAIIYGSYMSLTMAQEFRQWRTINVAIVADLNDIMRTFPNRTIEMGVGSDRSYSFTFDRPVLVFAGNPYSLDAAAAMDSFEDQKGLPEATTGLCRSGLADFILIPRGDRPFTLTDWYHKPIPVFSNGFIQAFGDNYERRYHSSYFDIYVRKSILNPAKLPT